jgi:hypothetical protein
MPTAVAYFTACIAGRVVHRHRAGSWLALGAALLFVSARGDKAPVLKTLLLYIVASLATSPSKQATVRSLRIALCTAALLFVLGGLLRLQYANFGFGRLLAYLTERTGAQLQGTYLTFALSEAGFSWPSTAWQSMLPAFARSADFIDFHRFLMLYYTGQPEDRVGAMSTLFIAEAYAIGGTLLLWLSPIVVGCSITASFYLWNIVLKRLALIETPAVASALCILSSPLSSHFSAFPTLKTTLLWLTLLLPLIVTTRLIDLLRENKPTHGSTFARTPSPAQHSTTGLRRKTRRRPSGKADLPNLPGCTNS